MMIGLESPAFGNDLGIESGFNNISVKFGVKYRVRSGGSIVF